MNGLLASLAPDSPARQTAAPPDWKGQLQLLIVQPSPFCNLDCDYCYLPDRQNTRRMDLSTLEAAATKIFATGLPCPELTVVWHAGEPLAVPREWYLKAFDLLAKLCPESVTLTHNIQTNGVLIDDGWVTFFQDHGVRVGVSIDGPDWLHDRHRRTRDNRGTHARVMRGIEALHRGDFPFHVICVLTRESLDHPDELFDFFANLGTIHLCLNIEEIESANRSSSLAGNVEDTEHAFRQFMARMAERLCSANGSLAHSAPRMRIREIDDILLALRHPGFGQQVGNSQNLPGQILSIAWDGRFATFSPELLGQSAPGLGDLTLGNVLNDPLPPLPDDARYLRQWSDIWQGIENCRKSCAYFNFCRGGAPSNKLGETGRFDTTETLFCRLTQKAVTDVVLAALDRDLPSLPQHVKPKPRFWLGENGHNKMHNRS